MPQDDVMTREEFRIELVKYAEELNRIWRKYAIYYADYRAEIGFTNREENLEKLAEAETATDTLVAFVLGHNLRVERSEVLRGIADSQTHLRASDSKVFAAIVKKYKESLLATLSDSIILHKWDTHVGEPTAERPIMDADKLAFARAVLAAAGVGEKS